MAQTILVTGGTGYIGGEVIDQLLERGHAVHTPSVHSWAANNLSPTNSEAGLVSQTNPEAKTCYRSPNCISAERAVG